MIIRDGHHAIKYSHDAEACLHCLLLHKEFSHLTKTDLQEIIQERADYSTNVYWTTENLDEFRDINLFFYDRNTFKYKITLYNFDELLKYILENYGFCCMACGSTCKMSDIGNLISWEIQLAIWDRQALLAPALICKTCAGYINMLFYPSNLNTLSFKDRIISDWCNYLSLTKTWENCHA